MPRAGNSVCCLYSFAVIHAPQELQYRVLTVKAEAAARARYEKVRRLYTANAFPLVRT